jgi:hypothetical protein
MTRVRRLGAQDYFSAPVLAPDGLHCCYDKIVLRKHTGP